ncbi:MAG: ABC transporter ATP-binding protein [Thermoplasmatota archaeon]
MAGPAIRIYGLAKSFGPIRALDGVTFEVPRGSVYGFLGPNGAGKTTTLGILTGLLSADAGSASILGADVATDLPGALAVIGALVEEPAFYPNLTARGNLRVLAEIMGTPRDAVDPALEKAGLAHAADQRYRGYSQGMRRRLGLAAALLPDPEVLILDEPTNGLDPAGQVEVRSILAGLAKRGRTVLLSSHLLHDVQTTCTHAAILRKGKVVAEGTMEDLLRGDETIHMEVGDGVRAVDLVRRFPGVRTVELDGPQLKVRAVPGIAADLNRMLVQAGITVSAIVREQDLQSRFFEVTEGAS